MDDGKMMQNLKSLIYSAHTEKNELVDDDLKIIASIKDSCPDSLSKNLGQVDNTADSHFYSVSKHFSVVPRSIFTIDDSDFSYSELHSAQNFNTLSPMELSYLSFQPLQIHSEKNDNSIWEILGRCFFTKDLEGVFKVMKAIVKLYQVQLDEVGKLSEIMFELNAANLFQPVSSKFFVHGNSNIGNKIIQILLNLYIQCGCVQSCLQSMHDHFGDLRSKFYNLDCDVLYAYDCISLCFYLVYLMLPFQSTIEHVTLSDIVHRIVEDRFNFINIVEIAISYSRNNQSIGGSSKVFVRNLLKDIESSFNLALKRDSMLECVDLNEFYFSFLLGSGYRETAVQHMNRINCYLKEKGSTFSLQEKYGISICKTMCKLTVNYQRGLLSRVVSMHRRFIKLALQSNIVDQRLLAISWWLHNKYEIISKIDMLGVVSNYIEQHCQNTTIISGAQQSILFRSFRIEQLIAWKILGALLGNIHHEINSGSQTESLVEFCTYRKWWMHYIITDDDAFSMFQDYSPSLNDLVTVLSEIDCSKMLTISVERSGNYLHPDKWKFNHMFGKFSTDADFELIPNTDEDIFETLEDTDNDIILTQDNDEFLLSLSCDKLKFPLEPFFDSTIKDIFEVKLAKQNLKLHEIIQSNSDNQSAVFRSSMHLSSHYCFSAEIGIILEVYAYQALVAAHLDGMDCLFVLNVVNSLAFFALNSGSSETKISAARCLKYLEQNGIDIFCILKEHGRPCKKVYPDSCFLKLEQSFLGGNKAAVYDAHIY